MIEVYPMAAEEWATRQGCRELIDHWNVSPKKREAEELIGRLAEQARPHRTIVDLGCGPGRLIPHLPRFTRYDGVDGSEIMLEAAREVFGTDARCRFVLGDIFAGAHYARPVDLLLSIDTSRHYRDPLGLLATILAKWSARHYLFSILHGPEEQELINGQVTATAQLEAWLAEQAVAAAEEQQLPGSPWAVRYVLLRGGAGA